MGCRPSKVVPLVSVSTSQKYITESQAIVKLKSRKQWTEIEKVKYCTDVKLILTRDDGDYNDSDDDESGYEDGIPADFWDQCQYMLDHPEYELQTFHGNDAPFHVPPWYSKHPRDILDELRFTTGLAGEDYFSREPCIGGLSQEAADDYFHTLIQRGDNGRFVSSDPFLVKFAAGELVWDEMPVGVIKRDICADGQDPEYNMRKPLTPEEMKTKRSRIAKRLCAGYYEDKCLEQVENWAQNMQASWKAFTALLE